jgi:uroporphyrinogen-III synthase
MVSMASTAPDFGGLRVAAFESRRAAEMAHMIEKLGGRASVSPSMREVPIARNRPAIDFARQVIAGRFDVVVLMTGVGVRHLLAQIEPEVDRAEFLAALGRTTTIARGPKPVAVLKEYGLTPTHRVPEPNTWRELLATIDREVAVAGRRVAVQQYGVDNPELNTGLAARGAELTTVEVYVWELPEDTGPLRGNVAALADGQIDVVLLTSSRQIHHLLATAREMGREQATVDGLRSAAVCSIGPTTSETLRELNLPVDIEPEHPKMGHLVAAAAAQAAEVLKRKCRVPRG